MSFGKGYIPDAPDARDAHISKMGLSATVPSSASLQQYVVEVLDQLGTSSCCANAWAQALRIADRVSGIRAPQLSSRLFLYYGARKYDGEEVVDQGTQLRSVAKAVTKFGRPSEATWPFVESRVNQQPPWAAFREAYDLKGPAGYRRVTTLTEIKQAIAAGHAVVGGVSIGQSFEDYDGNGIYSAPPGEDSLGGHALCICAFDERSYTICNSWSSTWGDGGYIHVAPSFIQSFSDLWIAAL